MIETANSRYQTAFERTWGEGSWDKFCKLVDGDVKVAAIRKQFTSVEKQKPMSYPQYSLWSARAKEVLA